MFNKRRNEERVSVVPVEKVAEAVSEIVEVPEVADVIATPAEVEAAQPEGSTFNVKQANGNLKPSIISEGFEFIGEIRSAGYLTIDGVVRGTLALHSIQIGTSGVLDGNVTCDTMNVKGNFSGKLDCRDLTIGSRAVVEGDVSFKSITIQRGGVVKGDMRKKS